MYEVPCDSEKGAAHCMLSVTQLKEGLPEEVARHSRNSMTFKAMLSLSQLSYYHLLILVNLLNFCEPQFFQLYKI